MKFTKLKAVAYKLNFSLIFWCIASSSACLRGDSGLCCEYSEKAVGIGILWCEQATALQTMICFSRAEQLHDATLSFTFLVHSCRLTQQHEVANSVLDLLQLCLLLQWSYYKGLHRHYQREKMEQTGHETTSWQWPKTPICDHKISHYPIVSGELASW